MENNKTPKIRFKGFTEAWEQREFAKLVVIERGGSPRPIDDYITESSNGLNWIKIGDAPSQGNYITKTSEKIKPEGLNKTREVFPGDLILSNSMSFGKPYIMAINGCIHDGWLLIRDTNDIFDLTFLCQLLGTTQMLDQYKSFAAGSTVNNLNKELVGKTKVTTPNKAEQTQIGTFFKTLDNLITCHQRKCDKLVNVKKSMLEKMFPKNGEKIPEIRFKGFTDTWEQRELGEVYNFQYGMYNTNPNNGGKYKIYGANGIIGGYDKYNAENSVIIGHMGEYAGSVIWGDGKHFVTYNGTISTPKDSRIHSKFGYYMMFQKDINKICAGSGLPFLSYETLNKIKVMYPIDKSEQTKIGTFFKTLDNLITCHQRELEKLKNIKKSLLEKMFV